MSLGVDPLCLGHATAEYLCTTAIVKVAACVSSGELLQYGQLWGM